jgi:hypothetical protein
MSLEDIETRLGPLFEAEVISNLKSANWKERLEGEMITVLWSFERFCRQKY